MQCVAGDPSTHAQTTATTRRCAARHCTATMPRRGKPSLAVLVQAFEGMEVAIELKNDVTVLGFVDYSDDNMK